MNTTEMAVGAGVLTVLGRWAKDEQIDIRIAVGVVFLAIILAVLPDEVGKPMAALVLVTLLFTYALPIIDKTGIADTGKGKR